jgi:hypothetical protein
MEHPIAMGLQHLGMDVEARVAELGDLLRKELYAVHRVAEDDGLVDLQLQRNEGLQITKYTCIWGSVHDNSAINWLDMGAKKGRRHLCREAPAPFVHTQNSHA